MQEWGNGPRDTDVRFAKISILGYVVAAVNNSLNFNNMTSRATVLVATEKAFDTKFYVLLTVHFCIIL